MLDLVGRTHILVLHLPIGILFFAGCLEIYDKRSKTIVPAAIYNLLYGLGALSAVGACITGYTLASSGDYGPTTTDNHFYAGLVTALLSILTLLFALRNSVKLRSYATLALLISIIITGHLGGNITHGEDFLNPFSHKEEVAEMNFNIDDISEAIVYQDIIAPVLNNKCVSCHGPNKVKGRLRMDDPSHLKAGGKSQRELLNGEGELLRRVLLPLNDDKHMPPKKKSQLSEEHVEVLRWWLENGSSFSSKVKELPNYQEATPKIEAMILAAGIPEDDRMNVPAFLPEVELGAPDPESLALLRKERVVALAAGEESTFLEVDFVNVDTLSDELMGHLERLASHIVYLRLSDTEGAQKIFSIITKMPNLVKLYLDGNELSNVDFSRLSKLSELRYLNISGSSVKDEDLLILKDLAFLNSIYAFETDVQLDSLPFGIRVFTGRHRLEELASDTLRL